MLFIYACQHRARDEVFLQRHRDSRSWRRQAISIYIVGFGAAIITTQPFATAKRPRRGRVVLRFLPTCREETRAARRAKLLPMTLPVI